MTNTYVLPQKSRFPLGNLCITAPVYKALATEDIAIALARHAQGDWGDMSELGRRENDACISAGLRLHSVYHDRNGVKFWIITEADRSVTTVLLPEDY